MKRLIVFLSMAIALAGPALAQDAKAGFGPVIPKATGEPHPEGNAYMRRWHMTMMRHDRDETVYEGKRDVNASLGECFDCHTVKDETGTPVTYADERHYCRVCHDFTAVRVDCFDCHRSTPEGFEEPDAHAFNRPISRPASSGAADVEHLEAYLKTVIVTGSEVQQ